MPWVRAELMCSMPQTSKTSMSVKETITTYDRIAADYAHRWQDRSMMARAMAHFLDLAPAGAALVDIGCGPGFDCAALAARGATVIGLDLSLGMLRVARPAVSVSAFAQADMRHLPLSGDVAGIWCNAALLHLSRQDAIKAMRQFYRVLQQDGALFLAVKEGDGENQRGEAYGADSPRYFTYWQGTQLDEVLGQQGFGIAAGWAGGGSRHRWLCRLAQKQRTLQ